MAKKAKVKRDRSPGYNERQRLMQRARDDKRRLEKLEVAKLEAKQDRDPRGVECSPASPLTEKEKEKKAAGRPRKAQKLSLTGARTKRALSLSRALARALSHVSCTLTPANFLSAVPGAAGAAGAATAGHGSAAASRQPRRPSTEALGARGAPQPPANAAASPQFFL